MVENRRAKTIRGERGTPWFHAPFDRRRPASRRSRKKGCGSEELKGDLSRSDRSLSEATASTTDDRGPFHFSLSFSLSLLTSVIIVRRITPWRPREEHNARETRRNGRAAVSVEVSTSRRSILENAVVNCHKR